MGLKRKLYMVSCIAGLGLHMLRAMKDWDREKEREMERGKERREVLSKMECKEVVWQI